VYTANYHVVKKQDHEFVQAGRGTTIVSLLPLKALAIGGATGPDQFCVPALGYELLNCCESQAAPAVLCEPLEPSSLRVCCRAEQPQTSFFCSSSF